MGKTVTLKFTKPHAILSSPIVSPLLETLFGSLGVTGKVAAMSLRSRVQALETAPCRNERCLQWRLRLQSFLGYEGLVSADLVLRHFSFDIDDLQCSLVEPLLITRLLLFMSQSLDQDARGTFVLQDNRFRWLSRMLVDPSTGTLGSIQYPSAMAENKVAQAIGMHLYFPCGIKRGHFQTLEIPVQFLQIYLIFLLARSKLRHYIAAMQVSIGLEHDFKALIHFMQSKTYCFHGYNESALSLA
ncbi:hypothetical protein CQW23_01122 [Capsicum baccatum]|uniref:Uncharacterized protein n=1 Tax=Capsicum baccatum TaxID=33114 RepID=A0A2G2XMT4_CAPBA|nr:hypothetical protein CQW23_01122 [Capsicum baccatum]